MNNLYWSGYDRLHFAARHILENADTSQLKNHNNFWPAGTTLADLETLLEQIISHYQATINLPPPSITGLGFTTHEILWKERLLVRLGIDSQGRISLFQPLDAPNVIKINYAEAQKLFNFLSASRSKEGISQ